MSAYVRLNGESQANAVRRLIESVVETAIEVGAARAVDPQSYPTLPLDAAPTLTAKALAGLLDAGCRPEGWEEAYFDGPLP